MFATMLSCHALWDDIHFWWALHQIHQLALKSVSPPLCFSLFRNNSHSFICEAVRLLRTSSAPCLHNRNSHSFPPNTSFYGTTYLNCMERASYDCGGTTGRTNRTSLSPPCTQHPEAHKTNLSKHYIVWLQILCPN